MRRIGLEVVSRDNDSAVIGYSVTLIFLFLRSWVFGNTFIIEQRSDQNADVLWNICIGL